MSLVHGGLGINCLSLSCYDAIVKDSGTLNLTGKLEEIPDPELRSSLGKLLKAPTVSDAHQIIRDEKLDIILDMAGTMKVMRTKLMLTRWSNSRLIGMCWEDVNHHTPVLKNACDLWVFLKPCQPIRSCSEKYFVTDPSV